MVFNLGVGLILSALYVFFRDVEYLWNLFSMLLMYVSAIFYTVNEETFGVWTNVFLLNPIYVYITYFRSIVIDATIPSLTINALAVIYAVAAFLVGLLIYKKNNHKFLYYV